MTKIIPWLCAACVICVIVCGLLAVLIFSMVQVTADVPVSQRGYTIEALAVQITILEIVLGAVGMILAVIGLFGYFGLQAAAEKKADETARRVASDRMTAFFEAQARQAKEAPENIQNVPIPPSTPTTASRAEGNE